MKLSLFRTIELILVTIRVPVELYKYWSISGFPLYPGTQEDLILDCGLVVETREYICGLHAFFKIEIVYNFFKYMNLNKNFSSKLRTMTFLLLYLVLNSKSNANPGDYKYMIGDIQTNIKQLYLYT